MSNRSKGYTFEHDLVLAFNKNTKEDGWYANRLGGTTEELPDLVITNNKKSMLFTIECKSTSKDHLTVPVEQIKRCVKILQVFSLYHTRKVILAFKFLKRSKTKLKKYEKARSTKTYFIELINLDFNKVSNVSCNSSGLVRVNTINKMSKEAKANLMMFLDCYSVDELKNSEPVSTTLIFQSEDTSVSSSALKNKP